MQALECKNNGYERKNASFKIVGVQEAEKGVTKKKKNGLRLKGVADRGASVRVGQDTEKEGKGYFKDRRPASNMDPYVVTSMMAETTIIGKQ